jgi:NAD(P)-dependent dehydrogenase (short-subunit alcohol dehydrogenase family)
MIETLTRFRFPQEVERTAVGYIGHPNDVANVVAFFAKPESHFITGMSPSLCRVGAS